MKRLLQIGQQNRFSPEKRMIGKVSANFIYIHTSQYELYTLQVLLLIKAYFFLKDWLAFLLSYSVQGL